VTCRAWRRSFLFFHDRKFDAGAATSESKPPTLSYHWSIGDQTDRQAIGNFFERFRKMAPADVGQRFTGLSGHVHGAERGG
jgi:hypothetical protein